MIAQADFHSNVVDAMEGMSDQVHALKALSGLLAGCKQHDVALAELPYLLDLIVEKQEALVDKLKQTSNVIQLDSKRSNR